MVAICDEFYFCRNRARSETAHKLPFDHNGSIAAAEGDEAEEQDEEEEETRASRTSKRRASSWCQNSLPKSKEEEEVCW